MQWRAFWTASGLPWRTELEIPAERQQELAEHRKTRAKPSRYRFPFKGMHLTRADVEWLLATHQRGRRPIDPTDPLQRGRQGLDLRMADVSGEDLSGLPLLHLLGGENVYQVMGVHGARFVGADLRGAELRNVDFSGVTLAGAHLDNANLSGARFTGANLSGAHLARAYLFGTMLNEADLTEVDGPFTHWHQASLRNARLVRANLRNAHLTDCALDGADLTDADISWHWEEISKEL
jgi:uncharacterized protein YjbI with pentapeptide repeats